MYPLMNTHNMHTPKQANRHTAHEPGQKGEGNAIQLRHRIRYTS